MLLTYNKPRLIVLPKTIDFFFVVSFLYFFTLHADLLQLRLAGFAIRANNLIGFALLVAMMLRYRKEFFMLHRAIAIPLVVMTLCILISLIFSPYKKRCIIFFFFYGMMLLVYFWLPYQMLLKFKTKRVLKAYFASFICAGLITLFQLHRFAATKFIVRPAALCYEPSYYALYMTPFIVLITFHYFFNQKEDFFLRKNLNLPTLICVHFLFAISCASSAFVLYLLLMALFFLFLFLEKFSSFRFQILKFIMGVASLVGILLALFTKHVLSILLKVVSVNYIIHHHSFTERFRSFKESWIIFKRFPFFGVGLGALPEYRFERWLAYDLNFPHYLSRSKILVSDRQLYFFESSNVVVEMLASLGIGGVLITLLFCSSFIYLGKKAAKINFMWTCNFFISTLLMLIILQINQGLLRTYVWVHVALAFAYFVKTIQLSAQDPLEVESA